MISMIAYLDQGNKRCRSGYTDGRTDQGTPTVIKAKEKRDEGRVILGPHLEIGFFIQLSENELKQRRSPIVMSNPAAKMGLRRQPFAFTELRCCNFFWGSS